jgi:alkylation response protein AidB-like acyl-CoA dehydrogenase
MLADMATDVTAARLMIRQGAATYDAGGMDRISSSITKLFVAKMATVNCMKAIQILGGSGYLKDYPVERYMRDAKLCEIGEGTNEVQRMVIARELCKFPERAVDI